MPFIKAIETSAVLLKTDREVYVILFEYFVP